MPFEQLRFVFSCSESDQGWQRVLGPAARLPSALTTRQGGEGIPTPLTDVFAQCRFSGLATSSMRQAARFTPQNGLSEEHIPTEHEGKTKQKNLAARTRTTSPHPADTVGRRNLHKSSSSSRRGLLTPRSQLLQLNLRIAIFQTGQGPSPSSPSAPCAARSSCLRARMGRNSRSRAYGPQPPRSEQHQRRAAAEAKGFRPETRYSSPRLLRRNQL